MTEVDHDRLVRALRDVARTLTADRSVRDVETALAALVRTAVDVVPGAEAGAVHRPGADVPQPSHATDAAVEELERLAVQLGQGPGDPDDGLVLVDDLAGPAGGRWPEVARAAVDAGYRSLAAVPLVPVGPARSTLHLWAREPGAFGPTAQLTTELLAVLATVALHGATHAGQLGQAVSTRDLIGQAKGILMERFALDDTEAFARLSQSSQETNMKLTEVARWLTQDTVERRSLP